MKGNILLQNFFQSLFLFSIVRFDHVEAWMAPFTRTCGAFPRISDALHSYSVKNGLVKNGNGEFITSRRYDSQGTGALPAFFWRQSQRLFSGDAEETASGAGAPEEEDRDQGTPGGDPLQGADEEERTGAGEEEEEEVEAAETDVVSMEVDAEEGGEEGADAGPGMLKALSSMLRPRRLEDEPGTISEGSMSLAYRSDNGTRNAEFYLEGESPETVNPYVDIVRRLSPGETIGRFMRTAPQNVQVAVRNTIMGLLGTLHSHGFETTALTTGENLANLMFQLQMTGYMFRNAEYRLSVAKSLTGGLPYGPSRAAYLLPGEAPLDDEEEEDDLPKYPMPKISGVIKLTMEGGQEIEVDADAYMGELRTEVEKLQNELIRLEQRRDSTLEQDLLLYIKSLPEEHLRSLTETISPEVLEAMRIMVSSIMISMGTSQLGNTLTQQTGSAMAQICMWQLVAGYNLRELEQREQIKKLYDSS